MDLATKLFSFTLGVEPNKSTLKELSNTLNGAVLTLAEKQKALENYAETAESQSYVVEAPKEAPKQKQPVVWQISQAKIKELQWKRAQLRQFEREKATQTKKGPSKDSSKDSPKESLPKPKPKPKPSQDKSPAKPSSAAKKSNDQGAKGTVPQKNPEGANPPKAASKSTAPKAKPAPNPQQSAKNKKA